MEDWVRCLISAWRALIGREKHELPLSSATSSLDKTGNTLRNNSAHRPEQISNKNILQIVTI